MGPHMHADHVLNVFHRLMVDENPVHKGIRRLYPCLLMPDGRYFAVFLYLRRYHFPAVMKQGRQHKGTI